MALGRLTIGSLDPGRDLGSAQQVSEVTGDADAAYQNDSFPTTTDLRDQFSQSVDAPLHLKAMVARRLTGEDEASTARACAAMELENPDKATVRHPLETTESEMAHQRSMDLAHGADDPRRKVGGRSFASHEGVAKAGDSFDQRLAVSLRD